MKRGFTLIELLVVVLIIGILAAVAVPQYALAVERSRAAEAFTNLRALSMAVQSWGLANGNNFAALLAQSDPMASLDITLPLEAYRTKGRKGKNFIYFLEKASDGDIMARAYRGNAPGAGDMDIALHIMNKKWVCVGRTKRGKQLCKSLGGKLSSGINYTLPL